MTSHPLEKKNEGRPAGRFIILVLAFLALLALGYAIFALMRPDRAAPPPSAAPVAEADLASRSYDSELLLTFTVAEPELTAIHYALQNVDTSYLELTLSAGDGSTWVLQRSQDLRTSSQGGGTWEQALPAGTYQLLLTAAQGDGTVAIYRGYLD